MLSHWWSCAGGMNGQGGCLSSLEPQHAPSLCRSAKSLPVLLFQSFSVLLSIHSPFFSFAAESLPSSLLLLSSGVSAGRPCLSRPSLGSLHPRLFPAHVLTPSFLLFPAHASKHYPHVLVPVRANVQHQSHPGGRHR